VHFVKKVNIAACSEMMENIAVSCVVCLSVLAIRWFYICSHMLLHTEIANGFISMLNI